MSGSTDEDTHSSPALVVRTASGGRGVRTLVPCGGAGRFVVMWPCHAPGQAGPQEEYKVEGRTKRCSKRLLRMRGLGQADLPL